MKDSGIIEKIQSINLEKDEKLIVTVDVGNMPISVAKKHIEQIKDGFTRHFNEVIIVPNTIKIEKVKNTTVFIDTKA